MKNEVCYILLIVFVMLMYVCFLMFSHNKSHICIEGQVYTSTSDFSMLIPFYKSNKNMTCNG